MKLELCRITNQKERILHNPTMLFSDELTLIDGLL